MKERKPAPTDHERLIEYEERSSSLRALAEIYDKQIEKLRERERDQDEKEVRRDRD
jgi:hypothetical protein